jgi:hypothetical protein
VFSSSGESSSPGTLTADTTGIHLPPLVIAPSVQLPRILSFAARPLPPLPRQMASGKTLPVRCFNPFALQAPNGTWNHLAAEVRRCVAALLHLPADDISPLLMIDVSSIHTALNLDQCMKDSNSVGFCVHNERDVLLCGLRHDLAASTFQSVAEQRGSPLLVAEAEEMIPIIAATAQACSNTFAITDDFTTRCVSCAGIPSTSLSLACHISITHLPPSLKPSPSTLLPPPPPLSHPTTPPPSPLYPPLHPHTGLAIPPNN